MVELLKEIGFSLPRAEEPLCEDDIRLTVRNRVSAFPPFLTPLFLDFGQGRHLPRPASIQRYGAVLPVQDARHEGRVRRSG